MNIIWLIFVITFHFIVHFHHHRLSGHFFGASEPPSTRLTARTACPHHDLFFWGRPLPPPWPRSLLMMSPFPAAISSLFSYFPASQRLDFVDLHHHHVPHCLRYWSRLTATPAMPSLAISAKGHRWPVWCPFSLFMFICPACIRPACNHVSQTIYPWLHLVLFVSTELPEPMFVSMTQHS